MSKEISKQIKGKKWLILTFLHLFGFCIYQSTTNMYKTQYVAMSRWEFRTEIPTDLVSTKINVAYLG